MNLIVAIAYHAGNAAQTEKLLDHIYRLNDRAAVGHVLLAAYPDVHAEMKKRIAISAELAFEGVHTLDLRPLADPQSTKLVHVRAAFRQVAQYVEEGFSWPFLWLEPDSVPTDRDWFARLRNEFFQQPKLYMGSHLKAMNADKTSMLFMGRVGIYAQNVASTIAAILEIPGPLELLIAPTILPRFTATKLIQQVVIMNEGDLSKVRPGVVLVHGDKNGHLLAATEKLLTPMQIPVSAPEPISEPVEIATSTKKRATRQPQPLNTP